MHDRTRPIALVCLLLLTIPAMSGCKRNAATGRLQLDVMSRSQEIALGVESRPQILEAYGQEIAVPGIRSYVNEIGNALAAHVEPEYADIPWVFTMLDSDVVNAFALPGGQVFVSRALAEMLDDEAELAGVLGHEIGHVTAEHVDQRYGRQIAIAGIAYGIGAAATESESQWAQQAAALAVTGVGVYSLKFDRGQELESDRLGMRYMARAKYDPSALLGVMEALRDASGGASQPEFLSTHPHPESRIEQIESLVGSEEYSDTQNNPQYVRNRAAYESRMLRPLALAPVRERSQGFASLPPEMFCWVCAARRADEE